MAEELTYVIITPYTIVKSRTGAIVSRLLSRLDLELVATQILAPDEELAKLYASSMIHFTKEKVPKTSQLLHDYIMNSFMPSEGRRHRMFMLIFRGENAIKQVSDTIGAILPENRSIESLKGETIRDTYADYICDKDDSQNVYYFEPAVLAPRSKEAAQSNLKLFAKFSEKEDNLVSNLKYDNPEKIEKTLVILKPDNWRYNSSRPGSIIDMFSRAGLRIIGIKLYQMPVGDALEFYAPVKDILKEKLSGVFGAQASSYLERKFNVVIDNDTANAINQSFGQLCAVDQFNQIIEFMTGIEPEECLKEDLQKPGKVKCMVLVYEGVDAVNRIRTVLGPTDPSKAPRGTVRKEFGHNIMINTAHASDSIENAKREMDIIHIHENSMSEIIYNFLLNN